MRISFITDEVSDHLGEALDFADVHEIDAVELRSVGGKNLLRMTDSEIDTIAREIAARDLGVVALASPLLKWACRGGGELSGVRTHGYELPAGESPDAVCRRGFEIARRIGARKIRVFSYLREPRPTDAELRAAMTKIVALSDEFGVEPVLEHESVCHVATIAEVTKFLAEFSRVKLLLDPGNFAEGGEWLTTVPPEWRVGHVHVKDYDGKEFLPVGDGKVNFGAILKSLPDDLTVSLETHCPKSRVESSGRSLAGLRRLL